MNANACVDVVDLLPDWTAGRLDAVRSARVAAHVARCADCAGEVALLRALRWGRPEPSADFADRVARAVLAPAPSTRTPVPPQRAIVWRSAWRISAAAVLVLIVGTAVITTQARGPAESEAGPSVAGSPLGEIPEDPSEVWILDDGAVAGAPLLDDLSDEALVALAKEMGA